MSDAIYSDLLEENRRIFDRFAAQGVDLSRERKFIFSVKLDDIESCRALRVKVKEAEFSPNKAVYGVADGRDEKLFSIYIEMVPEVEQVTKIEYGLTKLAPEFGNYEVFWEFIGEKKNMLD